MNNERSSRPSFGPRDGDCFVLFFVFLFFLYNLTKSCEDPRLVKIWCGGSAYRVATSSDT